MFCSNCGQTNANDARFCIACGRALSSSPIGQETIGPTIVYSAEQYRILAEGLASPEAKRRESVIHEYVKAMKFDSRIVSRIEELARNDPKEYVREAAIEALSSIGAGNMESTAYYQFIADTNRSVERSRARRDIVLGLLLLMVGLVLTLASYLTTGPDEKFLVFSGAILVGGYYLWHGVSRMRE